MLNLNAKAMEKLKCKVVMLPIEKAVELDNDSKIKRFQRYLTLGKISNELRYDIPFWIDNSIQLQHLYFVALPTEEQKKRGIGVIKEGDWFLSDGRISIIHSPMYNVEKCIGVDNEWIYGNINGKDLGNNPNFSFKIEATTDPSLNLPLIPQSFVDKYVEKQGKIEEVLIEMEEVINCNNNTYRNNISTSKILTYCSECIKSFIPRLRKDNTVIVSKVEEKMYTSENVVDILYQFASTRAHHLSKGELQKYSTIYDWWIDSGSNLIR